MFLVFAVAGFNNAPLSGIYDAFSHRSKLTPLRSGKSIRTAPADIESEHKSLTGQLPGELIIRKSSIKTF